MSAIRVDSVARFMNHEVDLLLAEAHRSGWTILHIPTLGGTQEVVDLDSIRPELAQVIRDLAMQYDEPLYEVATAEDFALAVERAREQVHTQKVVSINTVKLAAKGLGRR